MRNSIDFTKYSKIKTIYSRLEEFSNMEDKISSFDIEKYPKYDEILDVSTSFNSMGEYRSVIVVIGKIKTS